MSLLGIDLGTSSVKVVLTDPEGGILSRASADYAVSRPHPGWAETDPDSWWLATVRAVREVLGSHDGDPPVAVGLSGQMHGVVVCDDRGTPLRPAVLWADARAEVQLAAYRSLPDDQRTRLANPLTPGMAGPVLAWLVAHEASTMDAAAHALQPKDWLRARLTGRFLGEPSDASATLLFDVIDSTWAETVIEALGIPRGLLPELAAFSGENAGTLQESAADQLGLKPGVPVAAGAADTAASALGSGLLQPGTVQLTVGTGIQLVTPITAPAAHTIEAHPVTHRYRAATPEGWYAMGASITGGQTLDWVRRMLGAPWSQLYATAARGPRAGDPVFLPFLVGERTPHMNTRMRGAWVNLDAGHDREALMYSALEAIAFATADVFDALGNAHPLGDEVRLAGGGTVAPAWRQLLANSVGATLSVVSVPEASARGAGLLAAQSAGLLDGRDVIDVSRPRIESRVAPDSRSGALEERRLAYLAAVTALYPADEPSEV